MDTPNLNDDAEETDKDEEIASASQKRRVSGVRHLNTAAKQSRNATPVMSRSRKSKRVENKQVPEVPVTYEDTTPLRVASCKRRGRPRVSECIEIVDISTPTAENRPSGLSNRNSSIVVPDSGGEEDDVWIISD